MTFKTDSARLCAETVDAEFYAAFSSADEWTEERLARHLGVSQQFVSAVMSPSTDRHVPAWWIPRLPIEIALPFASRLLRSNNMDVRELGKRWTVDGSLMDEMRSVNIHLGKIAERPDLTNENIPALERELAALQCAIDKARAEIDARRKA